VDAYLITPPGGGLRYPCSHGDPDSGRLLVAGVQNGEVRVWEVSTGRAVWSTAVGRAKCYALAFAPQRPGSGVALVAATKRGLRVWDALGGEERCAPLPFEDSSDWSATIWSVAVGEPGSGRTIVAGASHYWDVLRWDSASGDAIAPPLKGHEAPVLAVHVNKVGADTEAIFSGSEDCTIRAWSAETGAPLLEPIRTAMEPRQLTSLRTSDGRTILAASDDRGTVSVFDAETGDMIGSPIVSSALEEAVMSLALVEAENGPRLVVSFPDAVPVQQWNALSGTRVGPGLGHGFGTFQRTDGAVMATVLLGDESIGLCSVASALEPDTPPNWRTITLED
jgi:WD40 repeat protein